MIFSQYYELKGGTFESLLSIPRVERRQSHGFTSSFLLSSLPIVFAAWRSKGNVVLREGGECLSGVCGCGNES